MHHRILELVRYISYSYLCFAFPCCKNLSYFWCYSSCLQVPPYKWDVFLIFASVILEDLDPRIYCLHVLIVDKWAYGFGIHITKMTTHHIWTTTKTLFTSINDLYKDGWVGTMSLVTFNVKINFASFFFVAMIHPCWAQQIVTVWVIKSWFPQ